MNLNNIYFYFFVRNLLKPLWKVTLNQQKQCALNFYLSYFDKKLIKEFKFHAKNLPKYIYKMLILIFKYVHCI